jgi:DNA-binding LacI/PurR family transcriptional regulator
MQMKIPEQISVISYDGLSWPDGKDYGLTTILEPAEETGRQSVDLLYQWVEKNSAERQRSLEGQLRIGKSVRTIT